MKPRNEYSSIEVAYPFRLRGTNQQTDTGLLFQPPGYRISTYPTGASSIARFPGLALGGFALHNRSGSTATAMAIGVRIPNSLWIAGQWTDATTTFTDDTTDAQSTTATDFPMETTTNNDGHIIACRVPFNAVSYNIATASSGGAAVRQPRFATAAGTTFDTTQANPFIQDGSSGTMNTGENLYVFAAPVTWGKSVSLATGIRDGLYVMNMRATTAPTVTAAVASTIEIFRLYWMTENVADNSVLGDDLPGSEQTMAWDSVEGTYGDGLVALFSTANDSNRVTALVRGI